MIRLLATSSTSLLDRNYFLNLLSIILIIAVGIVGGRAYLRAIRQTQGYAGQKEAVGIYREELAAMRQQNERLQRDLADEKAARAALEGRVHQLSEENKELRQLVMGERVPPAMQAMAD